MEVTLCLLSIIYFTVVMGQGPVAPGDFQAICRTDFRYRGAHEWIPYVNPTSAGVRGEVRWQVLVDQYDYQNLIEPGQTPPSPWETRDIDGDGLQFTDTGGGNCLFTIGVTSNSYRNPMANNWVFTQSVDYLEAIEVIVNASVRFRGCQQRAVADPPCRKNYVTLHRYDTNTPTTVSERTDPSNYQPYLGDVVTSRLELSTMDSGTIIMTYRRPQNFNFTHFGIQDTGTYGSVLRLLVYYKVAQGFEDGLVVCPSVALPPAGSGKMNTRSCMCKANATPTANLVRTCDENGVCQQSPAQCECNAGYEYNSASKTCQDINECARPEESPCPTRSHCINTLGSYVCSCDAGYQFVIMNGESQGMCIDVDECTSMMPCDVNATCTNSDGSFSCVCNPGYVGNGKICDPFNDDSCPQVCDQHCIQSSTTELFFRICACNHGYYLDADNHTCRDVNECFEGSTLHNCINAQCINTNGSFKCDCLPGYTKPPQGGNICDDIDECITLPAPCHINATCNNTEGSYVCHCQSPYFNVDNSNDCMLGEQPKINRIITEEKPNHSLTYSIGSDFCIEDPMNDLFQASIMCHLENEPQPPPVFHWSILYNSTKVDLSGLPSLQVFNETDLLNLSGTIELGENVSLTITCTVDNLYGADTENSLISLCGLFECQDGVTNNCSQGCTRSPIKETMSNEYKCTCDVGFAANRFGYCEVGIGPKINRTIIKEKPNHNLMYSIGSDFCIEDPINNLFRVTIMCPLENEPRPLPEFHWSIFYNDAEVNLSGLPSLQVFNESDMLNLSGTIELGDDVLLNITCTVENISGNDAENTLIKLCGPFECQDGVTNNCSQGCTRNETMSNKYKCDCDSGFAPNHFGYCEDIDECQDTDVHNCSTKAWCINGVGSFDCHCKMGYDGDGITCTFSRKVVISVISVSIVIVFIILTNVTIAGFIKTYRKFKPSTIVENIRRKIESRSLHKHPRLDKTDNIDVNKVVVTVTNPQRVVVRGSVREKLPPGLTIKSSHIRIGESIGQGEYGIVYKGCFVKNSPEVVAIKTLKGFFDENAVAELLTECTKMSTFNNPNVLTVKGVCLDGGPLPYIIMPYMANGSLLSFLKKERSNLVLTKDADSTQLLFTKKRLMNMCLQVAKGMAYLAGEGIIHRDLAARNCMIGMDLVIKVADFGLSVNVDNKDYYRITSDMGIKLPLKWMAPESLTDYIFSEMSDVWAYGVTCWEVFSGGQIPYAAIKPSSILNLLQQGDRLEMPNNYACSDDIYSMMLWCWEMEPDKRPSFSTLVHSISISLEAMADYLRLGPAVAETETTESAV